MREYGPEGFWWERMMEAGVTISPGMRPPTLPVDEAADLRMEDLRARQPLEIVRPLAILLCMRHRKRASECGCLAGGY